MAQVRAVRQVVGAREAHEQLVQERRLVAGAARGVEDGLVRRCERAQVSRDQREGVVPADRAIVGGTGGKVHGLGQATALAKPVVIVLREFLHRVRREEGPVGAGEGRLLGDGLRAVLAELEGGTVAGGVRPRAAGAVEAFLLVQVEQGRDAAHGAHPRDGGGQRHAGRVQAASRFGGRAHREVRVRNLGAEEVWRGGFGAAIVLHGHAPQAGFGFGNASLSSSSSAGSRGCRHWKSFSTRITSAPAGVACSASMLTSSVFAQ